jgi:hypothetical protein
MSNFMYRCCQDGVVTNYGLDGKSAIPVRGRIFIFRNIGFSDSIHRRGIKNKLRKTRRFGNWICFRPQVREKTYSVGSLLDVQ